MQSHLDGDANRWLNSLAEKAEQLKAEGKSKIAGGSDDEEPIAAWKSHGVYVKHLPDDEHGILRISVGGGDTPVAVNYCVIRGKYEECISLLEQALRALKHGPR